MFMMKNKMICEAPRMARNFSEYHALLARRDHDERISREESDLLFAIGADDGPIATDRE